MSKEIIKFPKEFRRKKSYNFYIKYLILLEILNNLTEIIDFYSTRKLPIKITTEKIKIKKIYSKLFTMLNEFEKESSYLILEELNFLILTLTDNLQSFSKEIPEISFEIEELKNSLFEILKKCQNYLSEE